MRLLYYSFYIQSSLTTDSVINHHAILIAQNFPLDNSHLKIHIFNHTIFEKIKKPLNNYFRFSTINNKIHESSKIFLEKVPKENLSRLLQTLK